MKIYILKKVLFLFCFVSSQVFAGYTITKIADTNDANFDDFINSTTPSINNSGTVAFTGELGVIETVYTGNGVFLTSVLSTSAASVETLESQPIISDNGSVVLGAEISGTLGLYNATSSSFIIDNSGSFADFSPPAVNGSDVVSFISGIGGSDLALIKTPPLLSIHDTTGTFNDFQLTDINDSGEVSYVAQSDGSSDWSVFSTSSGTPIFTTPDVIGSAVINNSGTVAYTDNNQVYSNTGGILIPSGGALSSFNSLSINNSGDLAVMALDAGDNTSIYARSSSGVLEKVLAAGDLIDGNQVFVVNMGQNAINDAGQITFFAISIALSPFAQIEGIYLATPDPVVLLGDINVDGIVDTADLLLINQLLLGIKTPTAAELNAADMNQDAALTAGDLVIHSRTVFGLI